MTSEVMVEVQDIHCETKLAERFRTGDRTVAPSEKGVITTYHGDRTPTQCLISSEAGQFSQIMLFRHVQQGFSLRDVEVMLSFSDAGVRKTVLTRIIGKSLRTVQRQCDNKPRALLNPRQSAVAFLYAQIFEQATGVFGTQALADEWLKRECQRLDSCVPLEMIDNPLGYQIVQNYLANIERGIYQ